MKAKYLLNIFFLSGLIVLLLNDHLLKASYGNWGTGKLSDFAGVFILPMFLMAVFRLKKPLAILITAVFFIFWKSPFSQFIIDGFNALSGIHWTRVVDFTDLLALLVLPLTWYVLKNIERYEISPKKLKGLAYNLVLSISIFAFFATSNNPEIVRDPSIRSCCQNFSEPKIIGEDTLIIPNAFTPNGDGINDFFQIRIPPDYVIDHFLVLELVQFDTIYQVFDLNEFTIDNGFSGESNGEIPSAQYAASLTLSHPSGFLETFEFLLCSFSCDLMVEDSTGGNCLLLVEEVDPCWR